MNTGPLASYLCKVPQFTPAYPATPSKDWPAINAATALSQGCRDFIEICRAVSRNVAHPRPFLLKHCSAEKLV